ncbi:MAG: nuclear transport factor 2 family protein [Pseudomonadales bacterium]|jgi:hypothetical protein|nr:nuclear transport factor 2 family protein [Pseudomonadales bacterium]MDP6472364.1 nuclear transport factor 2 family protein [Pseudomonadales bacterium]MDP6828160.1 nuclear transport factor 2 family protein [Pseudomonadales bacterium]MDP6973455.1 nuclear transport factor 2 family protein [Pseudomonadales bacterium]|tara:strand:- start:887 stop:1378 length:492 start_codon:yes stop_codon:yes gene_type:complete
MRAQPAFALLVLLLLWAPAQAGTDAQIKRACRELVLDYAYYRDRRNARRFADVFTDDAQLNVLAETWHGRQSIHDRLAGQPDDAPILRHLMSTIRIFVENESEARGVSYVTIVTAPANPSGSAIADTFTAVGEYHDQFRRTARGWKIARRTFVPVFLPPADSD